MQEYETREKGNKILKIYYCEDADSPREWDNLGKFVLNHERYNFPNELNMDLDAFSSWEEVKNHLKKEFKAVIVKPVGMYDHSGISVYIGDKHNYWDGGQLGFICILEEDIKKEYGKVTKETIKKAENVLNGEFETFKAYVEGEVFGFELYKKVKVKITKEYSKTKKETTTETEEQFIDSCWGYFGEEGLKQIKTENDF